MASPPIIPPPSSGGGEVEGLVALAGVIALAVSGWLGARFARGGKRQALEGLGGHASRSAPLVSEEMPSKAKEGSVA